jgi:hypothetical protein
VDTFDKGLRCQDVHSGLRNVDPNSPLLAPLADTRVVGMAATIAGLIRGRDVITDAQALKVIAAHQLDVDLLAFDDVIRRRCCVDWCGRRCAGPAMVSVLQVRREFGEGDSDTIVNGHVGSDLVVPAS